MTQTRGIVRSLLDLDDGTRAGGVVDVIAAPAELLRAAHVQVAAFGRLQQHPAAAADRDESLRAREAALAARDRAGAALRAVPSTDGTARLLGSILVDGERLVREVDVRDGAHIAGVLP